MTRTVRFTLAIPGASMLPTALTALAMRLPSFTVRSDREGPSGGWLVDVPSVPDHVAAELLDLLPTHVAYVFAINPQE